MHARCRKGAVGSESYLIDSRSPAAECQVTKGALRLVMSEKQYRFCHLTYLNFSAVCTGGFSYWIPKAFLGLRYCRWCVEFLHNTLEDS